MPDENPIQTRDERRGDAERDVLYLLTSPKEGQPVWVVAGPWP